MSQTTIVTALLLGTPSLMISLVGWLLKRLIADLGRTIEGLRADMKELSGIVGSQKNDLGRFDERLKVVEHEVERLRSRAA